MQFEESMKKLHAMAGYSQEQLDEIMQGILNLASEEDPFDGPIIGTPEEAYAVELSLSDAEIERLLEDVD